MPEEKVLFVCIHNSARSQMAEAFLKQLAGDRLEVESAGFKPAPINPLVVAVMQEIGIDLAANKTQRVFDLYRDGKLYSYVITVCDQAAAEKCPIFPGLVTRLHWSFEDPAGFTGTWEERLEKTRKVRDAIRERVSEWYRATFPSPGA
jgi:arsenate reductase